MRLQNGTLWFLRDLFSFSVFWGSEWNMSDIKWIDLSYNQWRLGFKTLDINWRFGRLLFSFTIWNMPFQKKELNW